MDVFDASDSIVYLGEVLRIAPADVKVWLAFCCIILGRKYYGHCVYTKMGLRFLGIFEKTDGNTVI